MKKLFSLIALVGVFAACQPETIETAFEVGNAEATISVTAVDVQSGADVTSTLAFTATAGTVTNGAVAKVVLTGAGALKAQTVSVSTTYKTNTYSAEVKVNDLLAGGRANYSVVIPVGVALSGYTFSVKAIETPVVTTAVGYMASATIDHAGNKWASNNNEYLLNVTVQYVPNYGTILVPGSIAVLDQNFAESVNSFAGAYPSSFMTDTKDFSFTASAYSYYTAKSTLTTTVGKYQVIATPASGTPTVAGTFSLKTKSSQIESLEMADPNAHGHYHAGHGTGSQTNAGGGIVYSE